MDFRFDPEERTIIAEGARSLARYLPRNRLEAPGGALTGWRAVAASGWLHAALEQDRGGAGLPLAIVTGLAREAGRSLAGEAFVNNGFIIPALLAHTEDPEPWLSDHLDVPGVLVVDGRRPRLSGPQARRTPWCFGYEDGLAAYRVVDDDAVIAVERFTSDTLGFDNVGGQGVGTGTIELGSAAATSRTVLTTADLSRLALEASIVHAATLVGLGEQALRDTVDYVQERRQFDRPIGRFQAVKHRLADVATELEIAWNATLYAALRPDLGTAAIAQMQASRAARRATEAMVQFFGGIAITWEHHAHLYLKTALTGAQRFGSQLDHASGLGRRLVEKELVA
jgi:alkylation response protein AidB-like acyl-CoA dehydrogenase